MDRADAHVGAKHRGTVSAMLRTILAQQSKAAAVKQRGELADALRARHGPGSARSRDDAEADPGSGSGAGRAGLHGLPPRALAPSAGPRSPDQPAGNAMGREIERRRDVVGHLARRCGRHPPHRRAHARGQRRVGRRAPHHEPGGARPRRADRSRQPAHRGRPTGPGLLEGRRSHTTPRGTTCQTAEIHDRGAPVNRSSALGAAEIVRAPEPEGKGTARPRPE